MTVAVNHPENVHSGNASNTQFDFDFLIENESELVVNHINHNGITTTLRNGVDYSIHELNNPNGSYITFPLATSSFQVLQTDEKINISLKLPIQQTEDFRNSLRFKYDAVEWTFDYIVRILQIFSAKLARCISIGDNMEISAADIINEIRDAKIAMTSAEAAATDVSGKIDTFNSTYDEKIQFINNSDVGSKLSKDMDNISEEGEKHFIGKYGMTNCITKMPDGIKLSLNNGTLSLLKDSVLIIPYGTGDLREYYPTGSRFLNDNLKVKDTQYSDGNFFVWAELQSNITIQRTANQTETLFYNAQTNELTVRESGNCFSGTSSPSSPTYMVWYNTSNNSVKHTTNGGSSWTGTYSFPLAILEEDPTKITNISTIFSGAGYIGSIVWVDKGIKGLIPNGRNLDNSLNNIEVTTSKLNLYSYTGTGFIYAYITENGGLTMNGARYFNEGMNYLFNASNICKGLEIADYRCNSGVISNFHLKKRFGLEEQDGYWITSLLTLGDGVTINSSTALTYDLTNYLPKDSNVYEVLVTTQFTTGTTSGNQISVLISSDMTGDIYLGKGVTRTNSTFIAGGTAIMIIGKGRYIKVTRSTSWNGTFSLYLRAYRKVK